ncbi:OmpA family protein [Sandarakinorhabdus sp.]|uniref:OmpA/MotB family protein n=1 Tax=Sandarakinorhabdus sp. TaxID=1916663 RepID=UPI0033414530
MARLSRRASAHHEEDEGYFVSMSDMLTGLLFVFIILLLYFAFQFRQTTQELTGANQARKELLEELQRRLDREGLPVEIDWVTGVLRLPDAVLFDSGNADLSDSGVKAVAKVANVMAAVMPCYTEDHPRLKCRLAAKSPYRIDALFIEGHTDKQLLIRGGRDTNIDLSASRAINTYLALIGKQPDLDGLQTQYRGLGSKSGRLVPILSVSGYGLNRTIPGYDSFSAADLSKNRRIDLRFLMVTPDPESARNMLLQ